MDARVQIARVYGSASQYGPEGRTPIPGGRLELPSFPDVDHSAWVLLGEPPLGVFEAKYIRRAVGRLYMEAFVGREDGSPDDLDDRVAYYLRLDSFKHLAESSSWFVTIAVERELRIDDEHIRPREYAWLNQTELRRISAEIQTVAAPELDILAGLLAAEIGAEFFENLLIGDQVTFYAHGKQPFSRPEGAGSGGSPVIRGDNTLNIGDLRALVSAVGTSDVDVRSQYQTPARLSVRSLSEREPWKRFMGSYLALEVLINRRWAAAFDAIIGAQKPSAMSAATLQALDGSLIEVLRGDASEVEPHRVPMLAKFTALSLYLDPINTDHYIAEFKKLESAKDELSLGRDAGLPVSLCVTFTSLFIALEFSSRFLGMKSSDPT